MPGDAVLADAGVFVRDDAITTLGVGKNMVRSIRHWCLAAGALALLAITALRLDEDQAIPDHVPEMQKIAFKKLLKALEPVMQTEELEEEERDIEAALDEEEEADEDEDDADDEDALDEVVDLRSLARARLFEILRWIRDQKVVTKPKRKRI